MSDSWIRSRYGWGAARLRLCPDLAPCAPPAPSLAAGLAELLAEARGLRAGALARSLPAAGILALGALCVATLHSTLSRDATDASPLEIVRFVPSEAPEAEPEPLVEEPPPIPEPTPVATPAPPPPAQRVAQAPPRPVPAPLPPAAVEVAKLEPRPRVEPPRRAEPPRRMPAPVAFEPAPAVAMPDAPAPPPLRLAAQRTPARPVARSAPARPSFAIDAVPANQAFDPAPREASAAPLPSRAAAPRLSGVPRSAAAPPRVAFEAPALAPRDVAEPPRTAARVAFAAPATQVSSRSAPAQTLDGVPLSSLAACLTDAEEDALKLDVMAARGERRECASAAGRYRFVETKNLNAFLLWVERAPSRKEADRCVELRLALECLHPGRQGRTRG